MKPECDLIYICEIIVTGTEILRLIWATHLSLVGTNMEKTNYNQKVV